MIPVDKTKNGKPHEPSAAAAASIRNSPLAMPRMCKAQQDIYRKALAEEDAQEAKL